MPRLMSFAKTVESVRNRSKTVTRRDGWRDLDAGTFLEPVEKLPLAAGEKRPIFDDGTLIEVVGVRRERLNEIYCEKCNGDGEMLYDDGYATFMGPCKVCDGDGCSPPSETAREGFPDMLAFDFVKMFCDEMDCGPTDEITRIEFRYVNEAQQSMW